MKSNKIKFGDYYMFSQLPYSSAIFTLRDIMYEWEPFCYSETTNDENDCVKWRVVRSKLMTTLFPKEEE
jgi:hypothetical protein